MLIISDIFIWSRLSYTYRHKKLFNLLFEGYPDMEMEVNLSKNSKEFKRIQKVKFMKSRTIQKLFKFMQIS